MGTSTCDRANPIDMIPASSVAGRGLSGAGQLSLGYADNNQSKQPGWTVHYDNVCTAQ